MTDSVARSLRPAHAPWLPAVVCAVAGFTIFQFWGNATLGYIHTRSLFWWWAAQWFDPAAESEHGIFILGISLWLFWRNLRADSEGPGAGRREAGGAALAAMLGGLALHLLGYAVQQTRLSIVALLLFAWGVGALAGGRRVARAAAFPLAFLVFAVPLDVLDTLGFYLRLGVIDVATAAAHLLGFEVVRNGTQLSSLHGGYQYDVAAACSGIRSLLALAALSLLVGYLRLRAWWARALLLVLCAPYAFLANVARILAIVMVAEWLGAKAGTTVHEWFGFLVFVIVLGLQFATVAVLRKGIADTGNRTVATEETKPAFAGDSPVAGFRSRQWAVAGAVLVAALLVGWAARRIDALQTSPEVGVYLTADGREPAALPTSLGVDWIGQEVPISAVERAILPPDTGFSRKNYVSLQDRTQQVFVSIVLSGRDRSSIHRPELCLVGQGWTIRGRFGHRFDYPGAGRAGVPATVLQVQHQVTLPGGGQREVPALVAYWFVGRGRVVATQWERMWWGACDRLRQRQNQRWAYVLVQTGARDGDTAALARLQAVLDQTLPAFETPPDGGRAAGS